MKTNILFKIIIRIQYIIIHFFRAISRILWQELEQVKGFLKIHFIRAFVVITDVQLWNKPYIWQFEWDGKIRLKQPNRMVFMLNLDQFVYWYDGHCVYIGSKFFQNNTGKGVLIMEDRLLRTDG